MKDQTRREFLKLTGAAGLGLLALPAPVKAAEPSVPIPAPAEDAACTSFSELVLKYDLEIVSLDSVTRPDKGYVHGYSDPVLLRGKSQGVVERVAACKQARLQALQRADRYFKQYFPAVPVWDCQGQVGMPLCEEIPTYVDGQAAVVFWVLIRVRVKVVPQMSLSDRQAMDIDRKEMQRLLLSLEHVITGAA